MRQIHDQTAPGGVWINADVCGPEDGDTQVWARLTCPRPDGFGPLDVAALGDAAPPRSAS